MGDEENNCHACDEGEDEDCDKKSNESKTGLVTFTLIAVLSDVIGMSDHHGTDEDGANEDVESCGDVDHMSYVLPRTEDSSQFLKRKIF